MADIELRGVEKWFDRTQVLKGVDLAIEKGEFVIFVGPSGCGKSTLLRLIAGLEETSRGEIRVAGRDATAEPPSKRGLAMVFQSYALYPHMSVRDNIGFSLKTAGVAREELARRVGEAAQVLKLEPFLDRRPPRALRRPAPARRHRALHRARPHRVPVRRAAVEPRRGAARRDALRDREAPPLARRHHDLT